MSSTLKPLVLVTGGTGFIGSHIIEQLLDTGYQVRATARPGKAASLKATYPNAGSQLEVIEIADISTSDFAEAFEGVGALIHAAATTYLGNAKSEDIFKSAIEGVLNIISAAIKAGVKKIVYTSTTGTLIDVDFKNAFGSAPINETAWLEISIDDIDVENKPSDFIYMASKMIAEKKFWELAKQHPDVDFTSVLPGATYGRWVEHYPLPIKRENLGTNDFVYGLIAGGSNGPNTHSDAPFSWWNNVANIAHAHVAALTKPPLKDGRPKRLIGVEGQFFWPEAADFLRKARPELASRLPSLTAPIPPQTTAPMDTHLTLEVLGEEGFARSTWQETLLETIDALLAWEKKQ